MKCKPWIRHFSPPKFQCVSSQFALHGLRALEKRLSSFATHHRTHHRNSPTKRMICRTIWERRLLANSLAMGVLKRLHSEWPHIARYRETISAIPGTPLLRAMGFLVSQYGQSGAITPPPFLCIPPLESKRSGGAIPPPRPQKVYLSDTCAIPHENKANGCETPGGVTSHWAAKVAFLAGKDWVQSAVPPHRQDYRPDFYYFTNESGNKLPTLTLPEFILGNFWLLVFL